jgi:hypothetical protein
LALVRAWRGAEKEEMMDLAASAAAALCIPYSTNVPVFVTTLTLFASVAPQSFHIIAVASAVLSLGCAL